MFKNHMKNKIVANSFKEDFEMSTDKIEGKLTKRVTENLSPFANLATNVANIPLEKEFINHNFGANKYYDEAAKILPYKPGIYSDVANLTKTNIIEPNYEQLLGNAVTAGQVNPQVLAQAFADGKISQATLEAFLNNASLDQHSIADAIESGKIDSTFLLNAIKNGTISFNNPESFDANFFIDEISNGRIDQTALINAFKTDAVSVKPEFILDLVSKANLSSTDLQSIVSIKDISFLNEVFPDKTFLTDAISNGKLSVDPTFIQDAIASGKISDSVLADFYQQMAPNGLDLTHLVTDHSDVIAKTITNDQVILDILANPENTNQIIAAGIRSGSVHPEVLISALRAGTLTEQDLISAGINLNNINPNILVNALTSGKIDPTFLNDALQSGKIHIDPSLLVDAKSNIDLTVLANAVRNGDITINNQNLFTLLSNNGINKQALIDAITNKDITINNPTALMNAGGNNILHDILVQGKGNVNNQMLIDAILQKNPNTDLTSINAAIRSANLNNTNSAQEHELLDALNINHNSTVTESPKTITEAIAGNVAGTAATFGIIGAASFAGPFVAPFIGVFLGKMFTGIRNIFRWMQGKPPIQSPVSKVSVSGAAKRGSLVGVIIGAVKGGIWGSMFGPLGILIGVGLGLVAGSVAGALGGATGAGVFNGLVSIWKRITGNSNK